MIKEIDGEAYETAPEIAMDSCKGCVFFDEDCGDEITCTDLHIIWVKCDLVEEVSRLFALLTGEERREIMAGYVGRKNDTNN